MATKRPKAGDWREIRRLRAIELKAQRWKQTKIAQALGVTPGAISQWIQTYSQNGIKALRGKPKSGAPARLSARQLARIPRLLSHGAEAYGYRGELWTYPRVAHVIQQEFGVRYHPGHVSKLMKALGWTPHKPQIRAEQRNDPKIERWRHEVWSHLKKSPARKKNDFPAG
jgi:transposase